MGFKLRLDLATSLRAVARHDDLHLHVFRFLPAPAREHCSSLSPCCRQTWIQNLPTFSGAAYQLFATGTTSPGLSRASCTSLSELVSFFGCAGFALDHIGGSIVKSSTASTSHTLCPITDLLTHDGVEL